MKQEKILNILKNVRNDLDNYVNALYKQTRMIELMNSDEVHAGMCAETTSTLMYAHTADELLDKFEAAYYDIEDILASKKFKKSILKELEMDE